MTRRQINRGAHGVAGEVGHLCVDPSGPRCGCGARGCVEAIASTGAILAAVRQTTANPHLTFGEAADLARGDHPAAREAFARAGHAIGVGISALVNLVGPERVVVSGEGVDAYDLLSRHIQDAYAAHAFGAAARCRCGCSPGRTGPAAVPPWPSRPSSRSTRSPPRPAPAERPAALAYEAPPHQADGADPHTASTSRTTHPPAARTRQVHPHP
ncbi:ROK family protein [Streptomyces sp. NRRL B-24572]|uniref:ROK family protein n=1 Tax=Streptomyces sp. NRRL B-24572 TaxID=1962156 RepID=UPI001C4EAA32|nr:ROK family protein [Streptomyces sp. NRRL B-24572]